jgi:hypothetical protein
MMANAPGEQPIRAFPSRLGQEHGAPSIPLVCYGASASDFARIVSQSSTLSCVAIVGLQSLERFLKETPAAGILAMSHMSKEQRGEAGEGLALFSATNRGRGALLYHSWERNAPRAAERALEVKADGVLVAPMMMDDMFQIIFGVLSEVQDGAPVPTTKEEHIARLRRFAPNSPFWNGPADFVSEYW